MNTAPAPRLRVRPVRPDDAAAEQAFVAALSPTSRYRRFHVGLRALPADVLARLTQVDHDQHVALVAQLDDGPSLVADARYVRRDDGSAEFALAVADAWQRRGLGRDLLQRLARHAAARGVHTLVGEVLADNTPMLRLLQGLGARFALVEGEAALVEARLELRPAGQARWAAASSALV